MALPSSVLAVSGMSAWQLMSLSDNTSKRLPSMERISSSLCLLLVANTNHKAPPPCPSPAGRGVVCFDCNSRRLWRPRHNLSKQRCNKRMIRMYRLTAQEGVSKLPDS